MSHFDPSTHPLSKKEVEHYTNLWCREQGIHSKDLETHPQIDDVILLKQFRKEFYDLPDFWRMPYNKIYKSVYQGKIPLKAKQISTLRRMAEGMIKWRHTRQYQANKIKSLRQNPIKKSVDNMTAKDTEQYQTLPWE